MPPGDLNEYMRDDPTGSDIKHDLQISLAELALENQMDDELHHEDAEPGEIPDLGFIHKGRGVDDMLARMSGAGTPQGNKQQPPQQQQQTEEDEIDAELLASLRREDARDELAWTRAEFEIPSARACGGEVDGDAIYFCGNSLGLLAKKARQHMIEELDVWGSSSVTGHFRHPYGRPWKHVDRPLTPLLAKILGAEEDEVAHTSTLTSNMHNLFTSFYNPTKSRWKIVIEKGSFPSDWYAVHSHPRLHDAVLSQEQIDNAIIPLAPRPGEVALRPEDILKVLEDNKGTIAIVWIPLVQYYTGQLLDIPPISQKTHEIGALLGLDLAHGTGNVEVKLNDWNVDFAVWCTYKYLNAGPAAIGGMFIRRGLDHHGRRRVYSARLSQPGILPRNARTEPTHASKERNPKYHPLSIPYQAAGVNLAILADPGSSGLLVGTLGTAHCGNFSILEGWWGNDPASRFEMAPTFRPTPGAKAWQHSCTPVFSSIPLLATLEIIDKIGIPSLARKGRRLTGELEELLEQSPYYDSSDEGEKDFGFKIITPAAPWRGSQLSLLITPTDNETLMPKVFERMLKRGLVGDERQPSVIRLTPAVLYNTFVEVARAVEILNQAMREVEQELKEGKGENGNQAKRDILAGGR